MRLSADYPRFALTTGQLSAEQRAFFQRYGFLHFRRFIEPDTVRALLRATEDVQRRWLADGVTKVNGVPIKYGHDVDGAPIVQRFAFASQHSPVLHQFLQDPRFAALFELLEASGGRIGENEKDGLVVNHYVNVPGSAFSQMGWHTDSLRDVFYGRRIGPMLNVGVHLDATPATNGGLRVLPGTHHQGLGEMLFRKRYFRDNDADPNEVAIETDAGDLTVHDGRMWHRVARSPLVGEVSRRRVMYVPIVAGKYQPKDAHSPTPFYLRFLHLVR
ncbi:phytanoyl-CoA dioxygenase family protein [Hymenobacter busanensis]|uniref:Phytanoyl-CoA dioxygenase family protein n=1 Tax=Hymenobacter busanensis TaxID=2607656 RepID=A0A7L4ZXD0_9BACT|nr:phytanoyl-CoA dioxygenase family protein [Hymenobacter busanensis]KAA9333156.1 phytanoyl-CoA dioxygenase family protein [Hymenobacter busanensis]QHJ08169.1 phytanoyl-CoA dioxygenase [Hymenobacter busanensis]